MDSSENCATTRSSSTDGEGRFLYGGNSMHFLFTAGDILETVPIAFDEVKKGDVIVFTHQGRTIVHRVRRITAEYLVTIGDNNAGCDAWQLTREDELRLVVDRIDRRKRRFAVARGWRGMVRFFMDRWLRFGVCGAVFCGRWLIRIVDWRRALPEPEKFGEMFCYIVRGRTVAWKNGERGIVQFSRWTDRLKYRSH